MSYCNKFRVCHIKAAVLSFFLLLSAMSLKAQEDELERLLNEEVENINPVYKPVVGFGAGVLNYFGDIKNNYYSPTIGTLIGFQRISLAYPAFSQEPAHYFSLLKVPCSFSPILGLQLCPRVFLLFRLWVRRV